MNFLATLDHLKASSIARKMSVYRSFYTYLAEYMGIIENPLIGIQTPKIQTNTRFFVCRRDSGIFEFLQ